MIDSETEMRKIGEGIAGMSTRSLSCVLMYVCDLIPRLEKPFEVEGHKYTYKHNNTHTCN